ncbi:uncharacterized protein ACRADG_007799 [Cochliomyia hominivorax]
MKLIRQMSNNNLMGTTIMLLTLATTQIVNGRPQDSSIFENIAASGLSMAGNMAEMLGDAGMINKESGFEMPFSKGNSKTQIGTGAAFRNENEDDSSEEDRRRRKRTVNLPEQEAPCHGGGGGGGTGGTGGGTGGGGGDEDVDVVERRRRAYARRMAARKKARNAKKTTRKTTQRRTQNKHLINEDEGQIMERRRKRQTELDDLNQNMTDGMSTDFQQQAQQIAAKIRNVFEGLMNQMSDMAQRLKQHFSGQNSTNNEEI